MERERSGKGGVGEAPISQRSPSPPGMGSCDRPRGAELGARRYPGCRLAAWKGARCVVRKLGDGKRELVRGVDSGGGGVMRALG